MPLRLSLIAIPLPPFDGGENRKGGNMHPYVHSPREEEAAPTKAAPDLRQLGITSVA